VLDDRARIHVAAGSGGDGSQSFRREAHVPRGGPDGGDGGRGGDVRVVCDESLRDLRAFRRRTHLAAGRGGHGEGSQRHGAAGEPLTLRVPPGTEIRGDDGDLEGRRWDLTAPGQAALLARGGAGGRGNRHFATSTRQSPHFAERGLAGEQGWLELRLRLLADVGLVGLPNAGKSSLLARMTRASPKVADYPFTTLEPVLGVIEGEDRQLVVADIPGLIEGASEGAGLGHDFLAHVERTSILVHVLDVAPDPALGENADPAVNFETVEAELRAHNDELARLPRLLALSKADLLPAADGARIADGWRRRLGPDVPVVLTSSATGHGVAELTARLLRDVPAAPAAAADAAPAAGEMAEHMVFRPAPDAGFIVERTGPASFAVRGRGIDVLLARFDHDNEDAMAYVESRLRRIGVIRALQAQGFQPGDEVEISGTVFELDPGE